VCDLLYAPAVLLAGSFTWKDWLWIKKFLCLTSLLENRKNLTKSTWRFQTYVQHVLCSVIRSDIHLRVLSVCTRTSPVIADLNTCEVLKHACFPIQRKQYTFLQNMTSADVISTGDSVSTGMQRKTAFTIRNTMTTKRRIFFIRFMFNIIQKNNNSNITEARLPAKWFLCQLNS
jgi:hypothetical protein